MIAPLSRAWEAAVPGSVVLDTAIGLVFVFLTASLICTAVLEYISNKLNMRGAYLLRGLREMLDLPPATPGDPGSRGDVTASQARLATGKDRRQDLQELAEVGQTLRTNLANSQNESVKAGEPLADLVLAHPLVAAFHRPADPGKPGGDMHLASYLSSRTFASSLIDLLVPNGAGRTSIDELTRMVGKLDPGIPARAALLALLRDTSKGVDGFRTSLEGWYDEQMGRVSGWYKRWAQWRLLIAGLLLAVIVNVDTIGTGQLLYRNQPLRDAVAAQAVKSKGCPAGPEMDACLKLQPGVLRDLPLPIGWGLAGAATGCPAYNGNRACGINPVRWAAYLWHSATRHGAHGVLLKLLGWALTGAAVSLGAPFWFDALSKLGSLRTAGRRPGENAPFEAPAAR